MRPICIAGGEQTLFSVTPDGKLYATGYGAGGRLGLGGMDSMTSPTLVESMQHVFIKKVAVNSGGKHCLALTSDGDGKVDYFSLNHSNFRFLTFYQLILLFICYSFSIFMGRRR